MNRLTKIMMAQVKNALKKPSDLFIPFPDDKNLTRWVVLVCGFEDAHEFGEYFCEFTAGPDFPEKAPKDFIALTENGVFGLGGKKICISLGEFHDKDKGRTDTWRSSLGMPGFAANIANVFIGYQTLESGYGIKTYPSEPERQKAYDDDVSRFAKQSRNFNAKHNPQLYERLENFIKHNPTHPAVLRVVSKRNKLEQLCCADKKSETKSEVATPATALKSGPVLAPDTPAQTTVSKLEKKTTTEPETLSEPEPAKPPAPKTEPVVSAEPIPDSAKSEAEESLSDILAEYL